MFLPWNNKPRIAYNLVWLQNTLWRADKDDPREPRPDEQLKKLENYIELLPEIAKAISENSTNENARLVFWVDQNEVKNDQRYQAILGALRAKNIPNLEIRYLNDLPGYDKGDESICKRAEMLHTVIGNNLAEAQAANPHYDGSAFWQKLDMVLMLTCCQSLKVYDQTCISAFNTVDSGTNKTIAVSGREFQKKLNKHGFLISTERSGEGFLLENQFLAFSKGKSGQAFLDTLYKTIDGAFGKGDADSIRNRMISAVVDPNTGKAKCRYTVFEVQEEAAEEFLKNNYIHPEKVGIKVTKFPPSSHVREAQAQAQQEASLSIV